MVTEKRCMTNYNKKHSLKKRKKLNYDRKWLIVYFLGIGDSFNKHYQLSICSEGRLSRGMFYPAVYFQKLRVF